MVKVPIGTWSKDKTLRLVGLYQQRAITDFIATLAIRPFRALGMPEHEAQIRLALAQQALEEPHVHGYFNYYFWYAQKPMGAADTGDTGGSSHSVALEGPVRAVRIKLSQRGINLGGKTACPSKRKQKLLRNNCHSIECDDTSCPHLRSMFPHRPGKFVHYGHAGRTDDILLTLV